jgi:hypothetical protein
MATTLTYQNLDFARLLPQDCIDLSELAYERQRKDIVEDGLPDAGEQLARLRESRGSVPMFLSYVNGLEGTWEVIWRSAKIAKTPRESVDALCLTPNEALRLAADIVGFPIIERKQEVDLNDDDGAPQRPTKSGDSHG